MSEEAPSATVLSRKDLYERLWRSPVSQLSKEFGLSDVGLAKLCRRHNVPRPPRGYWAKKQFGQSPKVISLPDPDDNYEIAIRAPDSREASLRSIEERTLKPPAQEPRIEVADSLDGAHPFVCDTQRLLSEAGSDKEGFLKVPKRCPLSLHVTQSCLRRSLLIADALLKALEAIGYRAEKRPEFLIRDVRVGFRIDEQLKAVKEEPEAHDLDGEYEFGHSRFRVLKVPAGLLSVSIIGSGSFYGLGCRQEWNETESQPLEKRLNSIVRGMIRVAIRHCEEVANQKRREQERQEQERRRQEQERQRAEKRKLYKAEKARVDDLLKKAKAWREAQELRAYIECVRQSLESTRSADAPKEDQEEWVAWAMRQADRLDPLIESPPSILDEELGEDDERPRQYPGYWNSR